MRYTVDAWLEKGRPRLRLMDERGAVRLDWACREGAAERDCAARTELQRLFKDLFLLAGAARISEIGPARAVLADACLGCDECVHQPVGGNVWEKYPVKSARARACAGDSKQPE